MIFETLVKLLSAQFGMPPEEFDMDTSFEDLGADSLDLVELSMDLEEEFGVEEMREEEIAAIHTVGDLVNYLQNHAE